MKKMMMIGGPVLLLLLVAAKMFLLPAAPPPDEKALAKEPGPIYTLVDPFVVNLSDSETSPHFAKVGIAMRFSKLSEALILPAKGTEKAHTESDSELRDIVISTSRSTAAPSWRTPRGARPSRRRSSGRSTRRPR